MLSLVVLVRPIMTKFRKKEYRVPVTGSNSTLGLLFILFYCKWNPDSEEGYAIATELWTLWLFSDTWLSLSNLLNIYHYIVINVNDSGFELDPVLNWGTVLPSPFHCLSKTKHTAQAWSMSEHNPLLIPFISLIFSVIKKSTLFHLLFFCREIC